MLVIFKYARETRYLWESCGKYFHKAEKKKLYTLKYTLKN